MSNVVVGIDTARQLTSLARRDATTFRRTAGTQEQEVHAEIDGLRLHVAVLYRMLIGKGIITADEARHLAAAIDNEDGAADQGLHGLDPLTGENIQPPPSPFADLV